MKDVLGPGIAQLQPCAVARGVALIAVEDLHTVVADYVAFGSLEPLTEAAWGPLDDQ